MMCLAGCAGKNEEDPKETTLGERQYLIYRVNSSDYRLTSRVYIADNTDSLALIEELFSEMKAVGEDGIKAAIPDDVTLMEYRLDDAGILLMRFTADYTNLSDTDELLCRAAIVYTLCQIEGVEGIMFYVADQALLTSSGRSVGVMTPQRFELSVDQDYKRADVVLYFADSTGKYLVPENRSVVYEAGDTLENAIVSEIIAGPANEGLRPVVAEELKVNSVYVTDNVCYIYLDSSFLQNTLDLEAYIPIYAFVNTLTEISYINRVQFVVDGATDVVFRKSISLASPFSANLDYILNINEE